MCGIAGIYAAQGDLACPTMLLEMAGELVHRGPDGVGLYLDGRFGMVNTRLSIIDVEGGDQPIGNENGRFWAMQNGEIYNYLELGEELRGLGHVFSTRSDTEVIAHAYEEWGSACLDRLNGEFAIAVWDKDRQELFLARDRFGIRPMFLADFGGGLCFGSEIKALLRHPKAKRSLDPVGLVDVFTIWTTQPEHTAFEGVRELPPGHFLRVGADGRHEQRRWWDLPFLPPSEVSTAGAGELAEELFRLLDDATRIRLRADVPVGVYVSGGLDSSATTALASRWTTSTLRGFGVGFADGRFDESVQQTQMADALGVDLSRLQVDAAEIAWTFPRVVELAECPLLRTSPAPLFRLSELARKSGFKVVLTGEGADELFAGYNLFRETMVRRFWSRQPDSRLRPLLLRRLYPYLASGLKESGPFIESFFGRRLQETDHPLYSHLIRFGNSARGLRLFRPELLEAARKEPSSEERLIAGLSENFMELGGLSRAQYLEIQTFMQGYLLHAQGDRMLMGNSVEGRFPFLDYRVAEFAAQVPERLRLRGMREKHLLRNALASLLPEEVVNREKRPYRAPILSAFVGPTAPDYVWESLSSESIEKAGIFQPQAVSRLLEKCRRSIETGVGETDEMALVGVLSSMLLHRSFVAQPQLARPSRPNRVVIGKRPIVPAEYAQGSLPPSA